MRHQKPILAVAILSLCCAVYAQQQSDPLKADKDLDPALREVYKLKEQIDRLEDAATQKSILLNHAVSQLSYEEKQKVEFLRPGRAVVVSRSAHPTAIVNNDGFLVGDQIIFVRRNKTTNAVLIIGKGRIKRISSVDAYAAVTDSGSGIGFMDEAYISSRSNSSVSLTKIKL